MRQRSSSGPNLFRRRLDADRKLAVDQSRLDRLEGMAGDRDLLATRDPAWFESAAT